MASESSSPSGASTRSKAAAVIARLDRIPIWSLSYLFIGIIGIGFLFTFLDFLQNSVLSLSSTTPAFVSFHLKLQVHTFA
jgi:putative MFS transporter